MGLMTALPQALLLNCGLLVVMGEFSNNYWLYMQFYEEGKEDDGVINLRPLLQFYIVKGVDE